jgi:hypothetical protein
MSEESNGVNLNVLTQNLHPHSSTALLYKYTECGEQYVTYPVSGRLRVAQQHIKSTDDLTMLH